VRPGPDEFPEFLCEPWVENPEEHIMGLDPIWMIEGAAEYAGALVAAKNGWLDFKGAMKTHMKTCHDALIYLLPWKTKRQKL